MPQTYRIFEPRSKAKALRAALLGTAMLSALAGCSAVDKVTGLFDRGPAPGEEGVVVGFVGNAVADEPQAALAARNVLATGGNAIDAAVAAGFTLTVSMPSRAGLGGGGACLVFPAGAATGPQAIVFPAAAPQSPAGDRPASVPMMARGLFAMHARYGSQKFESLLAPAEQAARFGVVVSRAFSRDLSVVGRAFAADPVAAALFYRDGVALPEGSRIVQPDLGSALAQIRIAGAGDFYTGTYARRLVEGAPQAGAALTMDDLRTALPRVLPPVIVPSRYNGDSVAFLPVDGGLAAAAAYQVLARDPAALEPANARALGVATRFRQQGGDAQALLQADAPASGLGTLPASTSLVTLDNAGNAVACAFSMNNLFGTGRFVPGTGILLAAAPGKMSTPLLSAAIAYNSNLHNFRAAVGGSGQSGAALATAVAMERTLTTAKAMSQPVPEPGRANVIGCSGYLPGKEGTCVAATDPRGAGLSAGSN